MQACFQLLRPSLDVMLETYICHAPTGRKVGDRVARQCYNRSKPINQSAIDFQVHKYTNLNCQICPFLEMTVEYACATGYIVRNITPSQHECPPRDAPALSPES